MAKRSHPEDCSPAVHTPGHSAALSATEEAIERCARIFRAMGDPARLRLIARLTQQRACVGDLAAMEGESVATISQRLRVLRADDVVRRTREGKHVVYFLADRHMVDLAVNGLAHASEKHFHPDESTSPNPRKGNPMSDQHAVHPDHPHQHSENCEHTAIQHDGHIDFLHNGHLHHPHEGHVDEHTIEVSAKNPDGCTDGHDCGGHDAAHTHGPDCGHEAVPHGDHTDYLVEGHLHHPHEGHCDNHGAIEVVQ